MSRRTTVAAALAVSCALVWPASAASASGSAASDTAGGSSAAAATERWPADVRQDSCDPVTKPGVRAFRTLVLTQHPDATGVADQPVACDTPGTDERKEGRAWVWAIPATDSARAADVTSLLHWLTATDPAGHVAANARRLGLLYIVWNGQLLDFTRYRAGWAPFTCDSTRTCSSDGVVFAFTWAGAVKQTSYWTRRVAAPDYGPCRTAGLSFAATRTGVRRTPCPTVPAAIWPQAAVTDPQYLPALRTWSGATLRPGSTGAGVTAVQEALNLSTDGQFGPLTAAALRRWQQAHNLTATGTTTPNTWQAMLTAGDAGTVTPPVVPTQPVMPVPPVLPPPSSGAALADRVLALAAAESGKPYLYGGAGPDSFDCSGLTRFVFGQVGISLPHNSAAQYAAVPHMAVGTEQPGDLIFLYDSASIYHVGIYAGAHQMWAATHTGDVVRLETVPTTYLVGRITT